MRLDHRLANAAVHALATHTFGLWEGHHNVMNIDGLYLRLRPLTDAFFLAARGRGVSLTHALQTQTRFEEKLRHIILPLLIRSFASQPLVDIKKETFRPFLQKTTNNFPISEAHLFCETIREMKQAPHSFCDILPDSYAHNTQQVKEMLEKAVQISRDVEICQDGVARAGAAYYSGLQTAILQMNNLLHLLTKEEHDQIAGIITDPPSFEQKSVFSERFDYLCSELGDSESNAHHPAANFERDRHVTFRDYHVQLEQLRELRNQMSTIGGSSFSLVDAITHYNTSNFSFIEADTYSEVGRLLRARHQITGGIISGMRADLLFYTNL